METHPILGWPIVTAENCFDAVRDLGICRWRKVKDPVSLDDFRFRTPNPLEQQMIEDGGISPGINVLVKRVLTPDEESDLRFVPKPMIGFWEDPKGKLFRSGYMVNKPAMTVIALIDGMVAVTAEWKHGIDRVTLVPVSGVPNKDELAGRSLFEAMHLAAVREWREETGTETNGVVCLSPDSGITVTVRNTETRYFEFLGHVKHPVAKGPTKFDAREDLKMLLFPWEEWLALIYNKAPLDSDFTIEACAITTTLRAARILGR